MKKLLLVILVLELRRIRGGPRPYLFKLAVADTRFIGYNLLKAFHLRKIKEF